MRQYVGCSNGMPDKGCRAEPMQQEPCPHAMLLRMRSYRPALALLLLAACSPSLRIGEPSPLGGADILLPPNYQGPVVIWYSRPQGDRGEAKGHRTVYRLPETGLLEVRAARQLMDDTLSMRFLSSLSGDSLNVLGNCRLHRRLVRGAAAAQVAGCWPPAYARAMRAPRDSVTYDAIVVADSAHLASAYDAAGRIITERLFGRTDAAFHWIEPRSSP